MKKLVLFTLTLVMLLVCAAACGAPKEIDKTLFTAYTVMRSDIDRAGVELEAALAVRNALELPIATDFVKRGEAVPNDGTELLVGKTNRDASIAALEELTSYRKNCRDDFIIRVTGNKIVIVGVTDEATVAAADYFIETFAPALTAKKLEEGCEYIYRRDYAMIKLNGIDIGEYTLLMEKDANVDIKNAAEALLAKVNTLTGHEIMTVTEPSARNIRIALGGGDMAKASVKWDGGDLVVTGGHYLSVAEAVKQLSDKLADGADLAADFAIDVAYADVPLTSERYPEMKLVWNDEFDYADDLYDRRKWLQRAQMTHSDVLNGKTERNVRSEDGTLIMRSWKEDKAEVGKDYSTNMSMTTRDSCNFAYGYLEMRAKVPFGKGYWPSFWMVQREEFMKGGYMTEIDIFEIFGTKDTVVPNIHKWYRDGSGKHTQRGSGGQVYKFTELANLNDEYHTYGFYWDETKMVFSVDGKDYATFDITAEGDYDKAMPVDGFHEPAYIILNNFLFTPEGSWCPTGAMVDDNTKYPSVYTVDYIRLWQGENGKFASYSNADDYQIVK
ncbi:MAG: glycoside hydrolase family 16 protein [Clostridia bacterium]|nr:glycoside hydrolase family 16 protein [Clostridia bacterium]